MKQPLNILLLGSILSTIWTRAGAGPVNDNFASRTMLSGTNITVQGNNAGATTEPGEYTGGDTMVISASVWYQWTAPTNGVLHVSGSTTVPNFLMFVGCYFGDSVSTVTAAPGTPDGGIALAPGDALKIKVASIYYPIGGGGGGSGPFTLTLSFVGAIPTSSNDAFTNRLEITTPTYHFDGSIYGAGSEPGEPLPGGTSQTLWWEFLPPESGVLDLRVSSAQFTPTVTVYDGNQFSSMTPVAPLQGTLYYLRSGHVYSVQMASGYIVAGGFSLDTRFYPQSHDNFATSEQVEGTNITYCGNFTMATLEPGEPVTGGTNTVWMSWAAPATGYVTVQKATSPLFQYYAVYTGPTVDHLQPVRLVDIGYNSIYRFMVNEGTVYHFQFSGGADNFVFYLQFQPWGACSNDNFADAQVVKGDVIYYDAKTVVGATMELGEPAHLGNVPQKSIWWKWQAPLYGRYYIEATGSLVTNLTLAAYTGSAVEALTLVGKSASYSLQFYAVAGQTYHIAGAVSADASGDVKNFSEYLSTSTSTHPVPGNLLQEPSWEGTGLFGAQYWHWSGSLGGWVDERGGADGTTWPLLGSGTEIWQDFPTTPGHNYAIRFAYEGDGAQVAVCWDTNQLGVSTIPVGEGSFWHWDNYLATASNTTSRISFQSIGGNVAMDAFSVVDASAAPAIVTQPASISCVAGGTAAFIVGATGTAPLSYQWLFKDAPLDGQVSKVLILGPVTNSQAGDYWVIITNAFGAVTSAVASLVVDAATSASILSQPHGDTVPVGGYYNFSVAAAGTPPLTYQWFLGSVALSAATNSNLMLTNVQPGDAGVYQVRVQNFSSTAWSLPATLVVDTNAAGGGTISFRNQVPFVMPAIDAPVFDVDGMTPLNGSNYVAQLYAGPSLDLLRPAGMPTPFRTGFNAGYFVSEIVTLANVAPGSNAFLQVCAWQGSYGSSYEQARALGGRFGKSGILQLPAGGQMLPPQFLEGLQSFSLQAGLPFFQVGTITFVERQPPDTMVWALQGQAASLYLIEKASRSHDLVWRPFQVITNVTGTVTFTDTVESGAANVWFRARILD